MKVIIDTNVAVDFMENREGFIDDAAKVFLFLCTDKVDGYLTTTSITTLYYILHHYFHDHVLVKETISAWTFALKTIAVMPVDCINALDSKITDYEDAVIAETAKREKFSYIVTRNVKDFEKSEVKAITPKEFLEIFLALD